MAQVLEHKVFSCTNLKNNSNKYWRVWLYDDGRIETQNGRQGVKDGQKRFITATGKGAYEAKIREKNKKGYHENEVVDGSGAIHVSAKAMANKDLKDIVKKQIKTKDPVVAKMLEFLIGVNAHDMMVASGGSITYDTSTASFKTEQGIIVPSQVNRARLLLSGLHDSVKQSIWSGRGFLDNVDEYLSLIPRDLGMKRHTPQDIFPNLTAIQKENDILDSLASSFAGLQMSKPTKGKKKTTAPKVFDVKMDIVTDKAVISMVKNKYQDTRKSMHQSNNLSVKTVYSINIKDMKTAYTKYGAKLKPNNIWQLWHGTKASNLLSIMRQGLVIPSSNANHVTARMFGDGVYFSDISTKALNYATNYWSGGGSTDRTFMFLADVSMGDYHIAKGGWRDNYPKRGSNSTFAKSGSGGVINNEMIVYRLDQCNLVYLVEFVKRVR